MKIDASTVNLVASHRASMRAEVRETLRAWAGDRRPDFEATERAGERSAPSVVALSAAALSAAQAMPANTPSAAPVSGEAQAIHDACESVEHDPMLYLIKLVVEMLTGVRVKTVSAADMRTERQAPCLPDPGQAASTQAPARAGFGIEYDRHEIREETERTRFEGEGGVRTADGREIQIRITLAMERSYREESDVSLRAGDGIRKDPLVINFDGGAAQLQSRRFSFDLDGDGKTENVPLLAGGRGYLALDVDGNGKIDSGKELFGAASGDGFAELARHDSDGNGWIDDNDPVFKDLRVWVPDDKGSGTLATVKERGVGALALDSAATPFELKDGGNQELGAVRGTGIYLAEDGTVGTVQQIDLKV